MNPYKKLSAIDVSEWTETKGNMKLAYLSWPFAVDLLMNEDPGAYWEFHDPKVYNDTMMVSCTVTAFGKSISMHLPVMDHTNKAIKNPDAFMINKNMMRCLVKAIACHGLGLKLYAGEDLPSDEINKAEAEKLNAEKLTPNKVAEYCATMDMAPDLKSLQDVFRLSYGIAKAIEDEASMLALKTVYDELKAKFMEAT